MNEAPPYGQPRTGGKVLPFALEKSNAALIVVHFMIADEDIDKRALIAQEIVKAMSGVNLNGVKIMPIVTTKEVEMDVQTTKRLATQVLPDVLRALGMSPVETT